MSTVDRKYRCFEPAYITFDVGKLPTMEALTFTVNTESKSGKKATFNCQVYHGPESRYTCYKTRRTCFRDEDEEVSLIRTFQIGPVDSITKRVTIYARRTLPPGCWSFCEALTGLFTRADEDTPICTYKDGEYGQRYHNILFKEAIPADHPPTVYPRFSNVYVDVGIELDYPHSIRQTLKCINQNGITMPSDPVLDCFDHDPDIESIYNVNDDIERFQDVSYMVKLVDLYKYKKD